MMSTFFGPVNFSVLFRTTNVHVYKDKFKNLIWTSKLEISFQGLSCIIFFKIKKTRKIICPSILYTPILKITCCRLMANMFFFWRHFQQYFSYIMATSFSGGGSRSSRREPPTMGKQLVNFITCGCKSSASFFVIYKVGREPTPYWWQACMSC
jgi:hypothetical protein